MVLILDDADVKKLNPPMSGAVEVIEKCFRLQASGEVTNHPRVHLAYPPSGMSQRREGFGNRTLRVLPAIVPGFNAAGFRTYATGPKPDGEARAVLVLFSFDDMSLKAIINDTWMHYIRTGAPAGVAAKYLARAHIDTMGVIGSGRIARRAAEAVACVRKVKRINVYSPTPENRLSYAKEMSALLGVEVEPRDSSRAVVKGAEILITATNAHRPVCEGDWLEPGTLVISLAPGETDVKTLERGKLYAAWKDQALHDRPPREPFRTLAAQDRLAEFEEKCQELHDVVAGNLPGRTGENEIITCLIPASSIWDPAMASWAYELARARGIGKEVSI